MTFYGVLCKELRSEEFQLEGTCSLPVCPARWGRARHNRPVLSAEIVVIEEKKSGEHCPQIRTSGVAWKLKEIRQNRNRCRCGSSEAIALGTHVVS